LLLKSKTFSSKQQLLDGLIQILHYVQDDLKEQSVRFIALLSDIVSYCKTDQKLSNLKRVAIDSIYFFASYIPDLD
jgi:hypothetical protein